MALATSPAPTTQSALTYEAYLAEGEVRGRYDIIDGVRVFMPSPTRRHQRIQGNIYSALRQFEEMSGTGQVLLSPCEILVRPAPSLRTRQPDVLFTSRERLAQQGTPEEEYAPLSPAPEIAVEILSLSEGRRDRSEKIADYMTVGVRECWVISPQGETVEILRLSSDNTETIAVYVTGQELRSDVFPDLIIPVADLFRD